MRRGDLVLTPRGLRAYGRTLPATHGRGGITLAKREGDGATPVGAHPVGEIYYRADRVARPCPGAHPIGPRDLWCDDPGHPLYNRRVRGPLTASHERMRRGDRLYDIVVVLGWNLPQPVPGRGSAIFVHRWRRPAAPTAGCIALRPADLRWLVRLLSREARLVVPEAGTTWRRFAGQGTADGA